MNSLTLETRADATDTVDRTAYPFRDRWIGLAPGTMHYVDEGAGEETLLFIHGTPSWSFEWRHIISALSAEYRSVAPDLIGFGLSDRPAEFAYSPEAHSEVINEFVEKLDLRNITLVVHDFGGPIGLPLALGLSTRVKRLVILNTWMWSLKSDKNIQRVGRIVGGRLGRFFYRWANLSLRLLMPSAYGNKRLLTKEIHKQYLDRFSDRDSRGLVLWPLANALLGSTPYYASLWKKRGLLRQLPTLILWGMKDAAFGEGYLQRWKEVSPQAEVVELKNAGHWPQEEEPEKIVETLRAFLKQ